MKSQKKGRCARDGFGGSVVRRFGGSFVVRRSRFVVHRSEFVVDRADQVRQFTNSSDCQ
jgi:hypothetical protein